MALDDQVRFFYFLFYFFFGLTLFHFASPGVSGHFSMMCGARISAFPGEILYPSYQGGGGFRDNGDPRGARVTNGLWTRNKAEITYNQKRRGYFPHVRYTISETWQMLQAEIPNLEQQVTQYRNQMVHLMEAFRVTVVDKTRAGSLLSRLGLDHANFENSVASAHREWINFKQAEYRKSHPQYPPGSQLMQQQQVDQENEQLLNDATLRFEQAVTALDNFIESDKTVNGMAGYYPWRKTFRRYVLFLYPLSLNDFLQKITPRPGFVWDLEYILAQLKKPLEAMNVVSRFAANVFDPNSIDNTNEVRLRVFFFLVVCFVC